MPVAKAYSGLTDEEIRELDRWIRQHTVERFGPVRAVEPAQVFELALRGHRPLARATSSGVAVRFPRMLRWRTDKTAAGGGHALQPAGADRGAEMILQRDLPGSRL